MKKASQNCSLPAGWGNDPLTQYLDVCRDNQLATFANRRSEVIDLITIDEMFRKLLAGNVNLRPFPPAFFLLRSHSAYRAACSAVMAGQLYEAQALLRVCLEQSGYAVYIGDDQARFERWMNRHESDDAVKMVRREFTYGKVRDHIVVADSALGSAYATLYERTIDYGAHPNQQSLSANMKLGRAEDGGAQFNMFYLQAEGTALDLALKTTTQVGICTLRLAKVIYPHRFKAAGVEFQLDTLSRRF